MTNCRTGKVGYQTRYEAREAATKIRARIKRSSSSKRKAFERDPYQCSICGSWHLTSSTSA